MAGSKNNPKNKSAMMVVARTCDLCGKTGNIDTEIQRVMRAEKGKRKLIWKCKAGC